MNRIPCKMHSGSSDAFYFNSMKKHLIFFCCLTLYFQQLSAQTPFETTIPDTAEIKKWIHIKGHIVDELLWTDSLGENLLITTETGDFISPNNPEQVDGEDAELYAYHYLFAIDGAIETWKVYDYIHLCPVDMIAAFVDSTTHITDLDSNGIAEIWLMYRTVCHGDLSPLTMKIIMYESDQKYALRGDTKIYMGTDDKGVKHYMGGEYKADAAFINGPPVFLQHAISMWEKHLVVYDY